MALVFSEAGLAWPCPPCGGNPESDFDLDMGESGIEEHVHGHGWFGHGTTSNNTILGAFRLRFYSRIMLMVPARPVFGTQQAFVSW